MTNALLTTARTERISSRRLVFLRSPLAVYLLLTLLVFFQIWFNGYVCFRVDHLTHIPMLDKLQHPGLFPRDWSMQAYAPTDLRLFHLIVLRRSMRLFSLPVGILLAYGAVVIGTFAAWAAISRRLFGRIGPGLCAILMAIVVHNMELGYNHILETSLIPRFEAWLFAWWAFFVLIRKTPRDWGGGLLAGTLMAFAGHFQPAIAAQFGAVLFVWLLIDPERRDYVKAGVFLATLGVLQSLPILQAAMGVAEQTSLTAAEQIQLAAYVRHPHHMIPHLWRSPWKLMAGLLAVFVAVWHVRRRECGATRSLARLAAITIAILAVCTVFIELIPVRGVILAQPYRLAVPLYIVMFLVIGRHMTDLALSGRYIDRARAVLLCIALYDWEFMLPAAAAEVLFIYRPAIRQVWGVALILAVCVVAGILERNLRLGWIWALGLPIVLGLAQRSRFLERTRLVTAAMAGLVLLGVIAISAFFALPLRDWINKNDNPHRKHIANLALRFQFVPVPIMGVERIGVWAKNHTEPDALFFVPQSLTYGFRLWARRSVWFDSKFFPYRAGGLDEWRRRYLLIRGIDIDDPAAKPAVEKALADIGCSRLDSDFRKLKPAQIVALARRSAESGLDGIGPIYIVTTTRYKDPALEWLATEFDRNTAKLDRRTYIYKIHY